MILVASFDGKSTTYGSYAASVQTFLPLFNRVPLEIPTRRNWVSNYPTVYIADALMLASLLKERTFSLQRPGVPRIRPCPATGICLAIHRNTQFSKFFIFQQYAPLLIQRITWRVLWCLPTRIQPTNFWAVRTMMVPQSCRATEFRKVCYLKVS